MNKWLDDYKNSESMVKAVMRDFPETRGDDRKLMLKVWEIQGLRLTPEQQQMFMKVFPAETIRRSRQKLHERGNYMPVKQVYEQRRLLDGDVRDYMKELPND